MECTKVKFITQKFANYYIYKANEKSIVKRKELRSYLCPFCLTWHITDEDGDIKDDTITNNKKPLRRKEEMENEIENLKRRVINLQNKNKNLMDTIFDLSKKHQS